MCNIYIHIIVYYIYMLYTHNNFNSSGYICSYSNKWRFSKSWRYPQFSSISMGFSILISTKTTLFGARSQIGARRTAPVFFFFVCVCGGVGLIVTPRCSNMAGKPPNYMNLLMGNPSTNSWIFS